MKIKVIEEFKEFAIKGNMMDIAIGVIIGTAFNKVIDVLVKEILLPPMSFMTDGIKWENRKIILRKAIMQDGVANPEEIAIGYGKLIEASIDFLVISITVFLVVKFMNGLRNKANDVNNDSVKTPKNIELLNEIAEQLKRQNDMLDKK